MTRHMNKSAGFGAVVMFVVLMSGMFWAASRRDEALNAVGDCVDKTANAQGYHGTPGQEWELFAEDCAKNVK